MDLYCIGELLIDFIPGTEKASYIRNAGGAPANVAIAAARNGLDAGMCCSVGKDDFGPFLLDTLKENGVKALKPELCTEAVTTMAFVTLTPDGDRKFTFARKPGADMMIREEDVKEEEVAASAIVHAGSFSLSASPCREATIKALKLGHKYDKLVSFDVNYRNLVWNDDVAACAKEVFQILPYVDILKISEEEVEMMGGEAGLPQLMADNGITLIVETLGAEGAKCFFGGKVFEIPGRKAKCVDATGAGDAFWGGFLSSLRIQGVGSPEQLTEEIIRTAMNYGNISGWLCVQSKGAISSLPTRAEIEHYL